MAKFELSDLTPQDRMALKESLYRRSLYDFARAAWPTIDPAPFIGGGFAMQAVCEHLEACANGGIRNLIINVPPRFSKSTITGTLFPAWCWAQKDNSSMKGPGAQFLFASYSQTLALQDSIKCRRLVESDWYRQFWGDRVIISSDQNTKSQFDLVGGGRRNTVSVGGSTTGMGGNCFVAGTRIQTPEGYAHIDKIRIGDEVLAFDHSRGEVVKSSVLATKSTLRSDLYEIRTSQGNRFICTGGHPIYCEGKGYISASELGEGDRVLRIDGQYDQGWLGLLLLREGNDKAYLRASEVSSEGASRQLLLSQMLIGPSFRQELASSVFKLWQAYWQQTRQILLGGMQITRKAIKKATSFLLGMWNQIYKEGKQEVLQSDVRFKGALSEYVRQSKFSVHGEREIWKSVPANGGDNQGEGSSLLCRLWKARLVDKAQQGQKAVNSSDSSSGREPEEQSSGESFDAVHIMPSEASSWHFDTIQSVCRISDEPQPVYDIQVEGFSNFFAEGVLVHNCLIADDPNNAREANSEAVLASTIEWWDMAWSTRLNDPRTGCRIVIQQRLSEEDITGHILSKDVGHWTHLCLPMKFEPERRTYNVLYPEYEDEHGNFYEEVVWTDPRNEPGELLWPERFGEDEVDLLERSLGPWAAAGQLQQRPEPKGGGIIKREWWQLWEGETYPQIEYMVAALDTAYTEKAENDFSAMSVWGVFRGGDEKAQVTRSVSADGTISSSVTRTYQEDQRPKVILLYAWQERLQLHDLVKKVQETMRQYRIEKLLIENKATGIPVAQELRRLYGYEDFVVQMVDPRGQLRAADKVSRIHSIVPIFADGLVYAPDRSWADMMITQIANFPKGKHDDLCLVGETMILMADGSEKRIDQIKIGEMVKTPGGDRQVVAAAQTGIKPTWRLDHSKGSLEGTGNHPVWANGEWKELDKLCPFDTLQTSYQSMDSASWYFKSEPELLLKKLHSMAEHIADTLTQPIRPTDAILAGQGIGCTEMSGNTTTDQFQRDSKSITLMETPETTTSQILSVWISNLIGQSTEKIMSKGVNLKNRFSTLLGLESLQKNGIEATKGVNGIDKMPYERLGQKALPNHLAKVGMIGSAIGAVVSLYQSLRRNFTALQYAETERENIASVNLVSPTHTMRPVYNLTVEGAHCYYANGILVHNCDTVYYALKHLRETGYLIRGDEWTADVEDRMQFTGNNHQPLYAV